jgi:geranylgeranyl pyrophosphate synthase
MQVIEATDAIAYTEDSANRQAQIAKQQIEILPSNKYQNALVELTNFAVTRKT